MIAIKKEHAEGRKGTILHDIIQNDPLRSEDKETKRVLAEALALVAAGYLFSNAICHMPFNLQG